MPGGVSTVPALPGVEVAVGLAGTDVGVAAGPGDGRGCEIVHISKATGDHHDKSR